MLFQADAQLVMLLLPQCLTRLTNQLFLHLQLRVAQAVRVVDFVAALLHAHAAAALEAAWEVAAVAADFLAIATSAINGSSSAVLVMSHA